MKKVYIIPEIDIVKIHVAQLLAGSDVNAAVDNTPTSNDDALGQELYGDF